MIQCVKGVERAHGGNYRTHSIERNLKSVLKRICMPEMSRGKQNVSIYLRFVKVNGFVKV